MTTVPPEQCTLCTRLKARRRGLCWSCHRKLREARLLAPVPTGRPRMTIEELVRTLRPDVLVRLRAALGSR